MHPQLFVRPEDALALLDESLQLRTEALKQFRSLPVFLDGDLDCYTRHDCGIEVEGLILEEALLQENHNLLPLSLTVLPATYQRLVLEFQAFPFQGHSWVDVFAREANPLTELVILFAAHQLPLARPLSACHFEASPSCVP